MSSIHIFIIAVCILAASSKDNTSEVVVFEMLEAPISFRFKSNISTSFSIGIGRRAPFYKDGQFIIERLSPSQLHRFEVNAWHSETRSYTMIHLKINQVNRSDGGTYTCRFGTPRRTQIKALTVNFPPGKADCRVYTSDGSPWEILRCSATGGSPRGRIVCFSYDGKEIPAIGGILDNITHIIYEHWIRKNSSAYCCAKNEAIPNKHDCYDFVLERTYQYFGPMDMETTPKQFQMSNSSSSTTLAISVQTIYNESKVCQSTGNLMTTISLVALSLAFILFLTSLSICLYALKIRNTYLNETPRENRRSYESGNIEEFKENEKMINESKEECEGSKKSEFDEDDINNKPLRLPQFKDDSDKECDLFKKKGLDEGNDTNNKPLGLPPFTETDD